MPIYAYKCASCGSAKDVLQKLSDVPLSQCPSCGEPSFKKQLTSAGFQLKGSGWYATDFKGGAPAAPKSDGESSSAGGESGKEGMAEGKSDAKPDSRAESKADSKSDSKPDGKSESKKADAPAAKKPDAAPAPGSA